MATTDNYAAKLQLRTGSYLILGFIEFKLY